MGIFTLKLTERKILIFHYVPYIFYTLLFYMSIEECKKIKNPVGS